MSKPQRAAVPDSEMFTPADLAVFLRLSPRKIRSMRATGELPRPIQFGRAVRWRRRDVEAWLDRLAAVAQRHAP